MSSDGNGNDDGVKLDIIKTLFWGWHIVKPWFKRKPRVRVYNTGLDQHAFLNACSDLFFCMKIGFAIGFFLFSIPIGIIRLIITIIPILVKKRTNTTNTNADGRA